MPSAPVVATLFQLLFATALAALAARFARPKNDKPSRHRALCLAVLAVVVLTLHALWLQDNLLIAQLFPFADVGLFLNAATPAAGILAGVLCSSPIPRWRRITAITLLATITAHRSLAWMFPTPAAIGPSRWARGVCRQTSAASCSPAAAATLLAAHGIPTTEAEMATLCLTSDRGTSMLGLYRGLALKTAGTPYRVAIFRGTADAFLAANISPAVISVGLPRNLRPLPADIDPRYERDWGWTPGVKHSVVYLGPSDTHKITIGDPSVGREQWFTNGLKDLWHGQALYLIPR